MSKHGASESEFGNVLGEHIGTLKTASEKVEIGICIFSLLATAGLWRIGYIGAGVVPFVMMGSAGLLYMISKAIGGAWKICDQGVEIRSFNGNESFIYEDVKSIVAKLTHHYRNHVYIATKAELTLGFDKAVEFELKSDFSNGTSRQQTVQTLIRRCSEGVERRLFADLQERGEVHWTQLVYLTQNGLKIADGQSDRVVSFEQIEEIKMADNKLKIWKVGDTLPFLVIPNDAKNFIPLFGLFRKLTESSQKISEQAAGILIA